MIARRIAMMSRNGPGLIASSFALLFVKPERRRCDPYSRVMINAVVAINPRPGDSSPLGDQGGVIRRRAQPDVLSRGISDRKSAATTGRRRDEATAVIAIAAAVPLRGVTDARPEMARGVAVEDRTAGAHETVRYRFTANRRGPTPPAGSAPRSIHARTAPRTRA